MFIAIEGIDGAGKSTQALILAAALREAGGDVLHTCEPSQSEIGKLIRVAIKPDMEQYFRAALPLLFFADRRFHLENEIKPALAAGKTVICDRYYLSTFVYQSLEAYAAVANATGADAMEAGQRLHTHVRWLHELARDCPAPTLTIVLDLPWYDAVERLRGRAVGVDKFEQEADLRLTRELYQHAAWLMPRSKTVHLDAYGSPEDVAKRVLAAVLKNT